MTQLTKLQKKKADKIAKLITDLKAEGVHTIGHNSNLSFYRNKLEFGEFPNQAFLYKPKQTVIIEDLNP